MGQDLSKETILAAFGQLNDELAREQVQGELCLFGGVVMVLAFQTRPATKDVDAVFQPTDQIRRAAATVQATLTLPDDWLNDGVKGWVSAQGETTEADLPQFSNLRITRPTASYLLAMKALAARAAGPEGKGDRQDIVALIQHLGLQSPEAVFESIEHFYPSQRILPKTEFLIREIFDEFPSA